MSQETDLVSTIRRLVEGIATDAEREAVKEALNAGRLALATGDRAAAIGGDATDAIIVTGDGNVVTVFKGLEAAALKLALDRLYPPRLRQLPADLADFIGREAEVAKLLAVLRGGAGQAAISALGGLGGVGKTALAVHVAHKLAPDYPEAQIVVDLMGTSESPLSPAAAMGNVIRAFHPEAHLPEDPREMEGLYRSVLHGKRAFLLLDNARDAAQVRPLLPPAPCGVLVTSRRTMVLPGVQPLNLDVLPQAQAVELLTTILGPGRASPDELENLARLCGHLPLALRVAGSFLAVQLNWTVSEYLGALADERERLRRLKDDMDDVEATLGLSAAQLVREHPDLAARWQMLSVFLASFDRRAAGAVWKTEADEARDNLSELLSRSLILFDPDKRRYRLHDLMRLVAKNAFEYAGEEPDREVEAIRLNQALLRHATHYFGVLHAVKELYKMGGEAIQIGLNLFDTEWDNIRAGQAWAVTHSEVEEAAAHLCNSYPDAGVHVLYLRLHPHELISWLKAALKAARHLHEKGFEGGHLANL